MFTRLVSLAVLVWLLGSSKTDAAVVLTGGEGRIDRGLEAVREGWARRLLVAGVDKEVRPGEFAAQYDVSAERMRCCVALDLESYDTRSNALEASRWLARNEVRSVRLITTDWHMRRAAYELGAAKPAGVSVIRDAVRSQPSLQILFLEYHKLIARHLSRLWTA
jgi:uncharacterized SAM-binding protein YcdF (DUF218 family)